MINCKTKKIKCYCDAGYRKWNESPIYVAHVVVTEDGDIVNKQRIDADALSSAYAEYFGLIYAMEYCYRVELFNVVFLNDSKAMIGQLNSKKKDKFKHMSSSIKPAYKEVQILIEQFKDAGGSVSFAHIPREFNVADKYVQECKKEHALD